ncbi:MAG: YggT family protein [Xenococcaceae cyanobacterium MO_188.B32]|nr:YggT family protein [Xenococcaceae cyanobacterium MO_188.B32]
MNLIIQSLIAFLNIYFVLLIVRILLSWFQTAEWAYQIMAFLSPVTDPYLNIFRSFIPPIGGIDISAILAIFALQFLQSALATIPTVAMGF